MSSLKFIDYPKGVGYTYTRSGKLELMPEWAPEDIVNAKEKINQ